MSRGPRGRGIPVTYTEADLSLLPLAEDCVEELFHLVCLVKSREVVRVSELTSFSLVDALCRRLCRPQGVQAIGLDTLSQEKWIRA